YVTTFPEPIHPITSPPTSPSICCHNWMKPRGSRFGATKRRDMRKSAGVPWKPWNTFMWAGREPCPTMSELSIRIERYLQELAREGASPHTIAAYRADLRQFLDFLSPPDLAPPEPPALDI